MRYTAPEKLEIIELVERSSLSVRRTLAPMAEVLGVRNGRVTFMLEEGRRLTLTPGDPQLRHIDRACASTVHAFQGRTVDNVIAAMEANHPQLTTAKAFYVEISRARDRAELVTDDVRALKERLETVTGEPILTAQPTNVAETAPDVCQANRAGTILGGILECSADRLRSTGIQG